MSKLYTIFQIRPYQHFVQYSVLVLEMFILLCITPPGTFFFFFPEYSMIGSVILSLTNDNGPFYFIPILPF